MFSFTFSLIVNETTFKKTILMLLLHELPLDYMSCILKYIFTLNNI